MEIASLDLYIFNRQSRRLSALEGAVEFVDWLRQPFQVVILSNAFLSVRQSTNEKAGTLDIALSQTGYRR